MAMATERYIASWNQISKALLDHPSSSFRSFSGLTSFVPLFGCWYQGFWVKFELGVAPGAVAAAAAASVSESSNSSSYTNGLLLVGITILEEATTKGAVCLDGSPPAYNLHPGFGSGKHNWLINLEGGGWCHNITSCLRRSHSRLGSSVYMGSSLVFSGILSDNPLQNPDFYNWNRVAVRYCDGSSFTGNAEHVNEVTKLRFRGQRIWEAVMEDLLAKGMDQAEMALLTGCSAGGLSTFLHCDQFRDLLPVGAIVKCMPDAGFFMDVEDISGERYVRSYFKEIVTLQESERSLPSTCLSKMDDPSLCFFPQHIIESIQTPMFILNAAYDSWQIKNILAPVEADPDNHWQLCKLNIKNCKPWQLKVMQGFRYWMLLALKPMRRSDTAGLFINSCYAHCQTNLQDLWHAPNSPRLNNKTIAEAVGDWFFKRQMVKDIDCPYPCDSTCHNRVFS